MDASVNAVSSVLLTTFGRMGGRSPQAYIVNQLNQALCKCRGWHYVLVLYRKSVTKVSWIQLTKTAGPKPLSMSEEGGLGVASYLHGICPSRNTSRLLQRGFSTLLLRHM